MKTRLILTLFAIGMMLSSFCQKPVMQLTFTARNNTQYIKLDSIKLINKTQGGVAMLYWPDTSIVIDYQVGLDEFETQEGNFQLLQNFPNPVSDQTTISMYVPERDEVTMMITDISGRIVINDVKTLARGYHSFNFIPGNSSVYFFTSVYKGVRKNIKIIHVGSSSKQNACTLENIILNNNEANANLKSVEVGFQYTTGDHLVLIGYANGKESGMVDSPKGSKIYVFQFATNIACPGVTTVLYSGQVYNTIQIFGQCWFKENLNIGVMINSSQNMEDDGIIQKYCHSNSADSCAKYGGLYQWDEIMMHKTIGLQGICPEGWHIPIDDEWKVLEGSVDSQYHIGNAIWDETNYRGFDAGTKLKSTDQWLEAITGTDSFGFSALPGGYELQGGVFGNTGYDGVWWSSPVASTTLAWSRSMLSINEKTRRTSFDKSNGFSVRCLKDL